ncbi:MAG: tryptophan synthase subunit beta, partial [Planctomycetota bacterium]
MTDVTHPDSSTSGPQKLSEFPDAQGRFGSFGGRYIPETLMAALTELEDTYERTRRDKRFWDELAELNRDFTGRPTPLHTAPALTAEGRRIARELGSDRRGATVWLKREDLAHTGAHKINNT